MLEEGGRTDQCRFKWMKGKRRGREGKYETAEEDLEEEERGRQGRKLCGTRDIA